MYQVETTMLKLEDIQPGFQLWITTEPHPKFPIGLLQMSIKVTNEARPAAPAHHSRADVLTCLLLALAYFHMLTQPLACFASLRRLLRGCAPGSRRRTLG